MCKVSVILTSYNHEKFIKKAIESVLVQTYKDFELLIWDDASSDTSWEIIQAVAAFDNRIKIFRNDKNTSCQYLNDAIKIAKGEFIAIHHSDDVWLPTKLEKQVQFLEENKEYGAVFSLADIIDEDNSLITDDKQNIYTKVFNEKNRNRFQWLNHFFYKGNCLCHPSILIRKVCYQENLYNMCFRQLPDFDFWIRLCMRWEICILQEKLVQFRILQNSKNTSGASFKNINRSLNEMVCVLQNFLVIVDFPEENFLKVFPEYDLKDISKECRMFWLAKKALKNSKAHATFGMGVLFSLMKERAGLLAEKLNFRYSNFHELVGKTNILLNRELSVTTSLFVDTGKGFNEGEKELSSVEIGDSGIGFSEILFDLKFDLRKYNNIKNLRWDPLEGEFCDLKVEKIFIKKLSDKKKVEFNHGNYKELIVLNAKRQQDDLWKFYTLDPQIIFGCCEDVEYVEIEGSAIAYDLNYDLKHMAEKYLQEKESVIAEKESVIAEKESVIAEKEGVIAEKEGVIAEKEGVIAEKEGVIAEKESVILSLNYVLQEIYNSKSWRWTSALRKIGKKIKKIMY